MPSITTSPHTNPVTRSNSATNASTTNASSHSTPSDAPFSTSYGEDALFENEIPFPFNNKHSGVIIENMGVKKAKNMHKGKASLLKSHITTVGSYYLYPNSSSSDPPPTLPSLSRNTTTTTTDLSIHEQIFHILQISTIPRISVLAPSKSFPSTKDDTWKCIHVGPADCELSIAFPETSHFEVWDMDEEYV